MTVALPIDAVIAALAAAGLGQTTSETDDWRLRGGYMQAAPDRSICVYAAGGRPPEAGQPVSYPQVQISVRGKPDDYQAVQAKQQEIYALLQSCDAPTVLGPGYVQIYAIQSMPLSLGQDENRRPTLVLNYRMMIGGA